MKRSFAAAFALLAALTVPGLLFAKGRTVKITIRGAALTAPIESTDEALDCFGVWEGPGVAINGTPQTKGFIIDWPKGVVAERRNGLQRHEVSFYTGCKMNEWGCRTEKPSLAYVVYYEYDPSSEQGYVYLPGKIDEWYQLNTCSIFRGGLEGNWFFATSEWQKFVRPLIERAAAESRATR
jgi:hypothetical protein